MNSNLKPSDSEELHCLIQEKSTFISRDKPQRPHTELTRTSPRLSHCLIFVGTSIIWLLILLMAIRQPPSSFISHHNMQPDIRHRSNLVTNTTFLTCGFSPMEARSLGCQYDILSNHWMPSSCIDEVSIKDYQSDGSWMGYSDENRTQMIDIDTMSNMTFYYTSVRDHIVHCAKLWKKQFRLFFDEGYNLDSVIVDRHHSMHCAEYLVNMTDAASAGVDYWHKSIQVFVGYSGCYVRN